ncbi:hypothetical protein A4U60_13480 [Priestia endophytica]|nr:hypothetical protein A4U60_13480 [Priestia endophytica]
MCFHGVRSLLINEPIFSFPFVSYLFVISGLIEVIYLNLQLYTLLTSFFLIILSLLKLISCSTNL